MRLIDTHCHINFPEHFPEPERTIEEAAAAGVDRLIAVGCDEATSLAAIELADRFPNVYAVVGWHPNYAATFDDDSIRKLGDWMLHSKVVAVGEIGLDYHWDYATKEQQDRALRAQLELAGPSPVVFHCRKAYPELLDIVEAIHPEGEILFHCFSGDERDAERILAQAGYIGVDGPLTYKNADSLRHIVAKWPRNKVVLETDSPYLPPEPHRGKPNRPAWTTLVNLRLASIWGVDPEVSAEITTENAEIFFCLDIAG